MKRYLYWPALALLLVSCAGQAPVPEDRFYELALSRPVGSSGQVPIDGAVEIAFTRADPLRNGRALLYRTASEPLRVQRYRYEYWIDQPPRMVHYALVKYLRTAGVARSVDSAGQGKRADYRLQTRLTGFEQLRGKTGVEALVSLEATLEKLPAGTVVWTKTYTAKSAAADQQMESSVQAMSLALQDILGALQTDLARETPR